jgi:hypothetical protein
LSAISGMLIDSPRNEKDDLREITRNVREAFRRLRISSAMPSEKWAWSCSTLRSSNGRTATE